MENKNTKSGKLIVLDGLDGCGGETQTKLLSEALIKKGKKVKTFSFPNYESPMGKILDEYLHSSYDLTPEILSLFHYAGFLDSKNQIEEALANEYIVICDRYISSTIVYQGIQGISYEKIEKLIEAFPIPRPDIIIYLNISAETSAKRKMSEKGNLDRFESDLLFLDKVSKKYIECAQNNIYCKQEIVDAEKSKEEVLNQILKIVENIL